MQIQVINKHSDFKIVEDYAGGAVPKKLVFETDGCTKYEASIENGRMKATSEEGKYVIVFEKPEFHVGRLNVTRFYSEDDADMPDGKYDWAKEQKLPIYIGNSSSEEPSEEVVQAFTPIFRGENVKCDAELSLTSENAVQNKVVTDALNTLAKKDVGSAEVLSDGETNTLKIYDKDGNVLAEAEFVAAGKSEELVQAIADGDEKTLKSAMDYTDVEVESNIKKSLEKPNSNIDILFWLISNLHQRFAYIYYTENNELKTLFFSDGNVDQPNFSSYTVGGKPSFYKCNSNTTNVVFENFDTSLVTNMSWVFNNCSKLIKLDVSKFDTTLATDMSGMFNNCSNLKTLDLSNFDTSSVTNMSFMFGECSNLIELDVSNFNTSAVTDMLSMFSKCKFSTLDVSKFNTSFVTNMSWLFFECINLTTLDLSNFEMSSVTSTSLMFHKCNSLKNIIGTHTIEEVQEGSVNAMRGLKVGISFSDSPNLERASILALFHGLADLTGKTAQTITLHATAKARLTSDDIKIATDKNWKVD